VVPLLRFLPCCILGYLQIRQLPGDARQGLHLLLPQICRQFLRGGLCLFPLKGGLLGHGLCDKGLESSPRQCWPDPCGGREQPAWPLPETNRHYNAEDRRCRHRRPDEHPPEACKNLLRLSPERTKPAGISRSVKLLIKACRTPSRRWAERAHPAHCLRCCSSCHTFSGDSSSSAQSAGAAPYS
jgi:hypothetical protein